MATRIDKARLDLALAGVRARIDPYARLMRLDRPIGNFLLLWPMLWALWIAAKGFPDPKVLVVFIAGVWVMRAAGCAINDFADRKIDAHVKRTAHRPLARQEIPASHAVAVFVILCLIALALVSAMNRLTLLMSIGGAVLAAAYPFSKRYTHLPQIVLGAAFGWAVPMAFAAQLGEVPSVAWLVFTAAVVWATIYDTQYAMVDREDDLKLRVKSTAILFGDADRVMLGILQALMLICLVLIGRRAELSAVYYWAVALGGLLFVYQQYLTWDRSREGCFKAFLNNNTFGAIIFAGVLFHYAYAGR